MDTLTYIQQLDAQGITGRERHRLLTERKQAIEQAEAQKRAELAQRYAQAAQRVQIAEEVIQAHTDDPVTAQLRQYVKGLALPKGAKG
jgi:hypothetical protein